MPIKKQGLVICVLLLQAICAVRGARILALFPYAATSHLIFFRPILEGLSERGHEVVFIAPTPLSGDSSTSKIKQHVPQGWLEAIKKPFPNVVEMRLNGRGNCIWFTLPAVGKAACEFLLGTKIVKDILSSDKKFDLMLTGSIVNECAFPFSYKLQVPYITMSSAPLVPWIDNAVWNPQPWSYVSNLYLPYSDRMGFWERFHNTYFSLLMRFSREVLYFRDMDSIIRRHLGDDVPSLSELEKNASLVFVNSDPSVDYPRPNLPTIIPLAATHCRPPKALPKELSDFVESSGDAGFILFSMGSVVPPQDFPPHILQEIVKAFGSIPQKVLWKWSGSPPEGVTKNVKLQNWLPQQDVLGHPKIRAFITHGGLQSTQEAIYHRVPVVGIPMFADQGFNIARAKRDGTGEMLEFGEITADKLLEALDKVANDTSYRENMERRSRVMKDKPVDPVQLSVYWAEYVIRHQGARHLRSAALDLSWYEIYLLDVVGVSLIALAVVFYVLCKIVRLIARVVRHKKTQDKKSKQN